MRVYNKNISSDYQLAHSQDIKPQEKNYSLT